MALPHSPTSRRRAWPPAALFVGAAASGLAPVADGDLWWHLAAGREMLRTGALLRVDPFSVSAGGRPWADVHWLFQLGVYGIHELGGLWALVLAKCALVGAGAVVLFTAVPRRARPIFVVIFLAAILAARHLLLARPVILTLLFLAVFYRQLERFRREGRASLLLPLPLCQVLWTNCQGLFALGPAVVGAYALGAGASAAFGERSWFPFAREGTARVPAPRRLRWLLLSLGLCLVGSAATPYGLRGLSLPGRLLARLAPGEGNVFAASVAENVPPFVLERLAPGEFWHLKWFLGVLFLCFALSGRRLLVSHLLLLVGVLGLGLMSNRNVLLLYWVAAPIAATAVAPAAWRAALALRRHRGGLLSPWVGRGAVVALLLVAGAAAAGEPNLGEPTPFRIPVASASVIEKLPGEGKIFAADHQSGYLIWALYPRFRPYIDTRLILRSPGEFAEYLGLADDPERFDDFQRRHGFTYVILPVAYPDRYRGLIAHLYASPEWKLIFTDGAEVLFARRDATRDESWDLGSPRVTDRMLGDALRRFAGAPRLLDAACMQIATLDIVVGQFAEGERALASDSSREADALRARSRFAAGDLTGAERIGTRALSGDGSDVHSLDLMAMICVRRGQLRQATSLLRRALAIDPFDGEATSLLGNMEVTQHER